MAPTPGTFEQQILLALMHLGPDAYGLSIREEIESRTGRSVSAGALYTALDRLEKKGLASSRLGDPTPQRGGKRKRLYTLESSGERALSEAYEALRGMTQGLTTRLKTQRG
jgi:PadR family transcriptional regulator, regulatory protein PadR